MNKTRKVTIRITDEQWRTLVSLVNSRTEANNYRVTQQSILSDMLDRELGLRVGA
jgi:hypothetical protein